MAKRQALLQICSNPSALTDRNEEDPAKMQALESLLTDIIVQRGEKVIVWSYYTASIEGIMNRFSNFNPVRIDGTVTDINERRNSVDKFQNDNETMLFVGNPAAAGAGITLHRARFAIYESMSNQAAHYLQSLDRIHRRGQTQDVEYFILLCDQTIEVSEYERLVMKERSAQALLGDQVQEPVTREVMLNETLDSLRLLEQEV